VWFLVPLMYLMLYTGNHATKVMENARVMEVTVTENARFTEGHGIRRDMGYGETWDTEVHGIWRKWRMRRMRRMMLGGWIV